MSSPKSSIRPNSQAFVAVRRTWCRAIFGATEAVPTRCDHYRWCLGPRPPPTPPPLHLATSISKGDPGACVPIAGQIIAHTYNARTKE